MLIRARGPPPPTAPIPARGSRSVGSVGGARSRAARLGRLILAGEQGINAAIQPCHALLDYGEGGLHGVHTPLQVPELPTLPRQGGLRDVLQKAFQRPGKLGYASAQRVLARLR